MRSADDREDERRPVQDQWVPEDHEARPPTDLADSVFNLRRKRVRCFVVGAAREQETLCASSSDQLCWGYAIWGLRRWMGILSG